MTVHAELLYLAEEIAEEMGNDHVWAEQLRGLAEEVNDGPTNGDVWTIGDMPLNENSLMDVVEQMAGQLNGHFGNRQQAVSPISRWYDADDYKDLIIKDWRKRDTNFSQVQTQQAIGQKYNIDPAEVGNVIDAYENGDLDENGKERTD